MTIRTLAQRNALATAYGAAAPYGALFSADPGTAGNATTELTGGSPAYARQAAGWAAASASAVVGATEVFPVASGSTVAYHGVTAGSVAGTADVRDSTALTSQTFSSQGTYSAVPTFTVS